MKNHMKVDNLWLKLSKISSKFWGYCQNCSIIWKNYWKLWIIDFNKVSALNLSNFKEKWLKTSWKSIQKIYFKQSSKSCGILKKMTQRLQNISKIIMNHRKLILKIIRIVWTFKKKIVQNIVKIEWFQKNHRDCVKFWKNTSKHRENRLK